MADQRISIAAQRAYTPTFADEFFLGFGMVGAFSTTDIPVEYLRLKKVEIFQNNTNAKSIKLYHVSAVGGRTSVADVGQYNYFNNEIPAGVTIQPSIFTWNNQLLTPSLSSKGSFELGPNIGDSAQLTFEPGLLLKVGRFQDGQRVAWGLRVSETNALDVLVTFTADLILPTL